MHAQFFFVMKKWNIVVKIVHICSIFGLSYSTNAKYLTLTINFSVSYRLHGKIDEKRMCCTHKLGMIPFEQRYKHDAFHNLLLYELFQSVYIWTLILSAHFKNNWFANRKIQIYRFSFTIDILLSSFSHRVRVAGIEIELAHTHARHHILHII